MPTLEDLAQGVRNFGGLNAKFPYPAAGTPVQQGVAGPPWQSLVNLAALNDRPAPGVTQSMPPFGGPTKIDPEILNNLINRRNLLYHATTPEGLQGIVESGKINPSDYWASFENDAPQHLKQQHQALEVQKVNLDKEFGDKYSWATPSNPEYNKPSPDTIKDITRISMARSALQDQQNKLVQQWRESPELKKLYAERTGVSVSRVPKLKTTSYGAPITLALDPAAMPASRPFAEEGFQKTRSPETPGLYKGKETIPNSRFEFENRTYNQPIPTSAVKEVIIDRSGLPLSDRARPGENAYSNPNEDPIVNIKNIVSKLGVPIREVPSGMAQHIYRALLGQGIIK